MADESGSPTVEVEDEDQPRRGIAPPAPSLGEVMVMVAAWWNAPGNGLGCFCRWSNKQAPRVAVLAAVVVALVAMIDVPAKEAGKWSLHDVTILRGEALIVGFYAALFFTTPIIRGLLRNELPIEMTARGAKYEQVVEDQLDADRKFRERLKTLTDRIKSQNETTNKISLETDRRLGMVEQGLRDVKKELREPEALSQPQDGVGDEGAGEIT